MKNIFFISIIAVAIAGCNSNNKKKEEVKSHIEVGVQNVNGNIPDTTNAIDLSTHKKVPAGMKDSSK